MEKQEQLTIYTTMGYENFEFMPQNRGIHPRHVEILKQSMLNNGFSSDGAIVCFRDGNKLKIVDGQHRFKAAAEAKIPIKYILIDQKFWREKIIEKNSYAKGWKLVDYLNHFNSLGLGSYKTVSDFLSFYKIPLSTAINILFGGAARHDSATNPNHASARIKFKDGTFVVSEDNYRRATEIMDKINRIRHFSDRYIKYSHESHFVNACYNIVTHPKYKESRMLEHLDLMSTKLVRCVDVDAYISIMSDIYNYRMRRNSKVDFFDRSQSHVGDDVYEESVYSENL